MGEAAQHRNMLHCSNQRSATCQGGIMDTKEVPNGAAAAEKPLLDGIEALTELYTSGIERMGEVQKKGLEIALQHNVDVVNTYKKMLPLAPGLVMLDLTKTAFERFAETQKGAIDLVVEQTHSFAKLVKERENQATSTAEQGKERAKEAIQRTVAAQKTALDFTRKQTKVAFEAAKQQLGYAGTPVGSVADTVQHGMEVMVETQKGLLDVLAGPTLH
jgi:hypothetical protein